MAATASWLLVAVLTVGCAGGPVVAARSGAGVLLRRRTEVGARYQSVEVWHTECRDPSSALGGSVTQDLLVTQIDVRTGDITLSRTTTTHLEGTSPDRSFTDGPIERTALIDPRGGRVGGSDDARVWPEQPVQVGDSWEQVMETPPQGGDSGRERVRRTLVALEGSGEDEIAVIEATATQEPPREAQSSNLSVWRVSIRDTFVAEMHGHRQSERCITTMDYTSRRLDIR